MLFNFNEFNIKKSNIPLLDRLAELLNDNKEYNIQIIGHTDDIGEDLYNLDLSERAMTIYNEMVKEELIQID